MAQNINGTEATNLDHIDFHRREQEVETGRIKASDFDEMADKARYGSLCKA